ncbi:MAG: hypothetical protein KJ558_17125 [Gammaproteobacteria bacterium]|nr:hypothetical protein [Gammaproteobacteria bacterium]MBU1962870.1 hypothetical protein [Gammaproteobacteria bacterium]
MIVAAPVGAHAVALGPSRLQPVQAAGRDRLPGPAQHRGHLRVVEADARLIDIVRPVQQRHDLVYPGVPPGVEHPRGVVGLGDVAIIQLADIAPGGVAAQAHFLGRVQPDLGRLLGRRDAGRLAEDLRNHREGHARVLDQPQEAPRNGLEGLDQLGVVFVRHPLDMGVDVIHQAAKRLIGPPPLGHQGVVAVHQLVVGQDRQGHPLPVLARLGQQLFTGLLRRRPQAGVLAHLAPGRRVPPGQIAHLAPDAALDVLGILLGEGTANGGLYCLDAICFHVTLVISGLFQPCGAPVRCL